MPVGQWCVEDLLMVKEAKKKPRQMRTKSGVDHPRRNRPDKLFSGGLFLKSSISSLQHQYPSFNRHLAREMLS